MTVKQLRLLTMLLASILFFACSDDEITIQGEVNVPQEVDLTKLEMWSYEVPFDVKSDSEWRIETTGDFCYAMPAEGKGDATVKLCIIDNAEQNRQDGELRIIFPKDEKKNITLKMQQKYEGDYDDNAVTLTEGNRVYAVGYGYNTTGGYANPESVKKPILQFAKMAKEELIVLGPINASFNTKIFTSSSIDQLSNELAASANLSCSFFGVFNSEISGSFNTGYFSRNNYEYALTYVDLAMCYANIEANLHEMRSKEYMTAAAYKAINGENPTYAGKAGVRNLIRDYGTHLCISARLGGRLRHGMSIDLNKVDGAYDAGLYAASSYDGLFINGSTSVDEKFKMSYQKNREACEIHVNVLGGRQKEAVDLSGKLDKANLNAWKATINEENMALVAFNDNAADPSLIPISELVDVENFPKRAAEIEEYLKSTDIKNEYPTIGMTYNCGTLTHFTIPEFKKDGTLVKQVKIDGHVVAQICEEYIPVINKDARVKVIYPILNNKVRHNMGLFVGNDSHRPARVSWEGKTLAIREYGDMKMGELKEVHIKGASITAPDTINKNSTVKGEVSDEYMEAYRGDKTGNYPIVKIFDKYWMKEDFKGKKFRNGDNLGPVRLMEKDGNCYYDSYCALEYENGLIAPQGWRVPTEQDFASIHSILNANEIPQIGKEFYKGGKLGFDAYAVGYYWGNILSNRFKGDDTTARYWVYFEPGHPTTFVSMEKSGGFGVKDYTSLEVYEYDPFRPVNYEFNFPMRFVKE